MQTVPLQQQSRFALGNNLHNFGRFGLGTGPTGAGGGGRTLKGVEEVDDPLPSLAMNRAEHL